MSFVRFAAPTGSLHKRPLILVLRITLTISICRIVYHKAIERYKTELHYGTLIIKKVEYVSFLTLTCLQPYPRNTYACEYHPSIPGEMPLLTDVLVVPPQSGLAP